MTSTDQVVRWVLVVVGLVTFGCEAQSSSRSAKSSRVESARAAIVFDEDDRHEWYESDDERTRMLAAQSVVVLMPRSAIAADGTLSVDAPSLRQRQGLCDSEPFAKQPAPAFCTGVLLDADLVLTAGHCAHAMPLQDMVAVFGYLYVAEGRLVIEHDDVIDVAELVEESFGDLSQGDTLDYAWLRLAYDAPKNRKPLAWRKADAAVTVGEPLRVIASASGTPVKIDDGARIVDPRSSSHDYFTASSDTTGGSSGGPAFTVDGTLLGILARGDADFFETENGCHATVNGSAAFAREEFTYAARAVERLCARGNVDSALCLDAARPIDASSTSTSTSSAPMRRVNGGCSVVDLPARTGVGPLLWWLRAFAVVILGRLRRRFDTADNFTPSRHRPSAA